MSKARAKRRELARKQNNMKQTFTTICESFVSVLMRLNFDTESEELEEEFDKHQQRWKNFARGIINRDIKSYNTKLKRERLLESFDNFVNKLIDSQANGKDSENLLIPDNKPTSEPLDLDQVFSKHDIPTIKATLTSMSITTKASTVKGLTKVILNLPAEQRSSLMSKLS